MKIDIWWHCCSADIAVHQMHTYIYYIHIVKQQRILRIAYGRVYTRTGGYLYIILLYITRGEKKTKQKKNLARISYTYIMFIYYYARLTTGRVLFFRRPANTENPPAVDNRNIHHIYNSFPIDTFTYFYVEDKKKIRWYCPRFSAIFPPFILLGDCRPVRHIVYTILCARLKVILSSFYYIYICTQSRRSLPQPCTSTSAEEVCYRSV